jgi:CheY-like chemotaxis protein
MALILVVDDDASLANAIEMVLENDGFEVVVANSGRRALELVESAEIDVAVLDIFMPGMDGFETIGAFRRRAPMVPIIAMSGFRDSLKAIPDVLATAAELGAVFSLEKPFRASDLVTAVKACSAFSLADAVPAVTI